METTDYQNAHELAQWFHSMMTPPANPPTVHRRRINYETPGISLAMTVEGNNVRVISRTKKGLTAGDFELLPRIELKKFLAQQLYNG